MTDVKEWLRENARGFNKLSDEEVSAISNFSLLWSLFEARIAQGNPQAICNVVDEWKDADTLDAPSFDSEFSYFQQRYFVDGTFTHHFNYLNLPENALGAMVRDVINGSNSDPRDRVVAVLIIISRYRNNLFHGAKWQYELAGQLENFTTANTVLMNVLDAHGALSDG